MHDLFSLDAKLLRLVRQMPVNFKHSKRNMYEQFVVYKEYAYLTMHLCYHQSRLVLYSSLVPLFSGLEPDRSTSPELTSMSAKISLQSAQAISEVAADFLALDWDAAHLPAFPGYCMYVSASIQLVLLSSEEEHLVSQARTNLVANLKLLRSLKDHWSNLSRLVSPFRFCLASLTFPSGNALVSCIVYSAQLLALSLRVLKLRELQAPLRRLLVSGETLA